MDLNTEIMIFILAGFIGYYIIWGVTPSLHAPLMSVANAISGIIILGSIEVINDSPSLDISMIGFIAAMLAAINIFGGFAISQRMLEMFKTKDHNKDRNS